MTHTAVMAGNGAQTKEATIRGRKYICSGMHTRWLNLPGSCQVMDFGAELSDYITSESCLFS